MKLITKARISTVISIGGVILTAITAAKDSRKATLRIYDKSREFQRPLSRGERALAAAPSYIPTFISIGGTIGAIMATGYFNSKQFTALASAYTMIESAYQDYRTQVDKATDEIAEGHIIEKKPRPTTHTPENQCWYLDYVDEIFERPETDILKAQLALNEKLAKTGGACVNDFLCELGLPKIKHGDVLGWDYGSFLNPWIGMEYGYFEVDNMEVFGIQFSPRPWIDNIYFPTDE